MTAFVRSITITITVIKQRRQLDRTLCEIAERYGASRREWVMMEMEYAGAATACAH